MIKGISRRIIEVCDEGNEYFERILLFVRPGCEEKTLDELRSAAVEQSGGLCCPPASARALEQRRRKRRKYGIIRSVVWGLCGAALCIAVQLLFLRG